MPSAAWKLLPEQKIQRAVIQHLDARAPRGAIYWHNWSGGYRRPAEAAIMKALGVVPGLPDLMIVYDSKIYALELKTEDGRPSEAQLEMIARLNRAGAFCAVTYGLDAALRVLKAWKLLRGES